MTGSTRPTPPTPMPPSADDVGWGYRRAGDDVGWGRSSSCASGGCLEAIRDGDMVLVRDSKLGDDSPVQEWPVKEWAELLRVIRVDGSQRAWRYTPDFSGVVLTRGSVELTFTSDEWDDFVSGVLSGDFEPGALNSAAPVPAPEPAAANGAVGRDGHRAAADRAGEGDVPPSPSPVAAMNGAPISASTVDAVLQLVKPEIDDWDSAEEYGLRWAREAIYRGVAMGWAAARAGDGEPAWRSGPLVQHVTPQTDTAPAGSASGREGAAVVTAAAGPAEDFLAKAVASSMEWVAEEYRQCIASARCTYDGGHYERVNGRAEAYRQLATKISASSGIAAPNWDAIKKAVPPDGIYRGSPTATSGEAPARGAGAGYGGEVAPVQFEETGAGATEPIEICHDCGMGYSCEKHDPRPAGATEPADDECSCAGCEKCCLCGAP
jgi:hypothetical protein